MKTFVTGGAGYIGSHTVLELLREGYEVAVFDNLSNSNKESIARIEIETGKKIELIIGDIRDQETLQTSLGQFKPDCVIHFAGVKSVNESVSNPFKYYDINVNGMLSLLKSMMETNCKRIIFSSSATVYGNPDYLPINENHPTVPENPYGKSKLVCEKILSDLVKSDNNFRAICLRYFNPIGADFTGLIGEYPTDKPNNLLPYILNVVSGEYPHLNIYGNDYQTRDGTGERDYIHVTDVAKFHVKVLEKILILDRFEILNIGTGKCTSVLELVKAFEQSTGLEVPYFFKNRRDGDVASVWADTELAEKKLDFKCERNITQACADAWRWQGNRFEN